MLNWPRHFHTSRVNIKDYINIVSDMPLRHNISARRRYIEEK